MKISVVLEHSNGESLVKVLMAFYDVYNPRNSVEVKDNKVNLEICYDDISKVPRELISTFGLEGIKVLHYSDDVTVPSGLQEELMILNGEMKRYFESGHNADEGKLQTESLVDETVDSQVTNQKNGDKSDSEGRRGDSS